MMASDFLLHVCCAPCAAGSVPQLFAAGIRPILYFSNSNLDSEEEFRRRLEAAKILADYWELQLEIDPYDHAGWLASGTAALADAPEGGARCARCFAWSLRRTAMAMERLGCRRFATTLTVSPWKNNAVIFQAGAAFPGFEPWDFKQNNGFRSGAELVKKLGLYRQKYCGCEFGKAAAQSAAARMAARKRSNPSSSE